MVADCTQKGSTACSALSFSAKWHVIWNRNTKINQKWQEQMGPNGSKEQRIQFSLLRNRGNRAHNNQVLMAVPYLEDYYYAVQLRAVICWCDSNCKARWRYIETGGLAGREGFQIQTLLGDRELFRTQGKLLDTITKFTLDIWNTVIKRYKLEKETKVLGWLMTADFNQGKMIWGN